MLFLRQKQEQQSIVLSPFRSEIVIIMGNDFSWQNIILVKIPLFVECVSKWKQERLKGFVMETHCVQCAVRKNIAGITTTGLSTATQCQLPHVTNTYIGRLLANVCELLYVLTDKISVCHPLFLGEYAKLWKATISFIVSVRPSAWNNSAPTGRIFMKFDIRVFLKNCPENLSFIKIGQ